MSAWTSIGSVAVLVAAGWALTKGGGTAAPPPGEPAEDPQAPVILCNTGVEHAPAAKWTFAREPRPITTTAERALDWLVARQLASGGWGQGEESEQMGHSLDQFVASANVADSCMATLSLLRAGAVPGAGARGEALSGGIAYVCGEVEEADEDSLYVTDVRGTRVQMKIGTYVDTFLASMLLTEARGRMGEAEADARVERALAKVLRKIERNQQQDGGFAGSGWAPVLSQAMAGKALNRASQSGVAVSSAVNTRNADFFLGYAEDGAGADSAGIALYGLSAKLGGLRDFVNTSAQREGVLEQVLTASEDEDERKQAREELQAIGRVRASCEEVERDVVARLEDPAFVAGFGSNGGEEFLSYMNLSESLVVKGGEVWQRWEQSLSANLARVQNQDGSWTGHHCITGRTFVTSAALLSLLADRAPIPVEALEEGAE